VSAEEIYFVYVADVVNVYMSIDKFTYCREDFYGEGFVGLASEFGEACDEFVIGSGCGYEERGGVG
jgi:hypothetical protein